METRARYRSSALSACTQAMARATNWDGMATVLGQAAVDLVDVDLVCVHLEQRPSHTTLAPKNGAWERDITLAASDRYADGWRAHDPLLEVVRYTPSAVHDGTLMTKSAWHAQPIFGALGEPCGLDAYLVAPLVFDSRVLGMIGLARQRHRRAFADADLLVANGLAERLSLLATQRLGSTIRELALLSPLERRIAEMANDGSTAAQIAASMGGTPRMVEGALRRVYRKLHVSSRIELMRRMVPLPPLYG